ncbi:MAG: hypothetical protein HFJ04_09840 [Lachnospiraceae bacterium]|nr:hypothetical protein [Lachnospiraceae bacterium]
MRHVYIRGILAVIWLITAIVSGVSGNLEMAAFYSIVGVVLLYSAYAAWKQNGKGGR